MGKGIILNATAQTPAADAPLLVIEGLRTCFRTDSGLVTAVNGVNLTVPRGRVLAVVGESGCGKSVMAYSILRLIQPPGFIAAGRILIHPRQGPPVEVTALRESDDALYRVRGGLIGMVFQEPMTALSPVHTIGAQVGEAVALHRGLRGRAARPVVLDLLRRVGLPAPEQRADQYPHELSGGMRQRVVIAMALAGGPELLIADEPTTALDVTVQAQIMVLLRELCARDGLTVLLITHDLGVVAQMADETAVMYLGRVVERAPTRALIKEPLHPYTRGLLASLPGVAGRRTRLTSIPGTVPALHEQPAGCPFHPRCAWRRPVMCDTGAAPDARVLDADRLVACVRAEDIRRDGGTT